MREVRRECEPPTPAHRPAAGRPNPPTRRQPRDRPTSGVAGESVPVEPLMTARDVAAVLAVGERTIWRMTSRAKAGAGRFPKPVRLTPKTVRWRRRDVQEYLEDLSQN